MKQRWGLDTETSILEIELVKILQELAELEHKAALNIKGKMDEYIVTNKEITDDKPS